MKSISLVMAVHNEEKLLPITLPTILSPRVQEYIFLLDRCTDDSRELIQKWVRVNDLNDKAKLIPYSSGSWKWRTSEVYQIAFKQATKDLIYKTDADILYDPRAFHINHNKGDGYTSFDVYTRRTFKEHLYHMTHLKTHIKEGFTPLTGLTHNGASCMYVTPRELWQRVEFKDTVSGDSLDYLKELKNLGCSHRHIKKVAFYHLDHDRKETGTKSRHNKKKLYLQLRTGIKFRKDKMPLWRVLLWSFIRLEPHTITGYRNPSLLKHPDFDPYQTERGQ